MSTPEDFGDQIDQPPMDEAAFAQLYGHVQVTYGKMVLPLSAALAMEAEFCAPTVDRTDLGLRLGHLAQKVASADALKEEHRYLLPPEQPESE